MFFTSLLSFPVSSIKVAKVAIFFIIISVSGCNNSNSPNSGTPLSSPFGEKLSVDADNQGNFMAIWKDGASIFSADYVQGAKQTPFRVAFGDNPDLAMSNDGNLSYISWNSENTIVGNTRQRAFTKVYDRTQNVWSDAIKEPIFLPFLRGRDSIKPKVAVYDDLLVLTNTIKFSTLDFLERITTSQGTSTFPFFRDMNGYTGGGARNGWFNAETGITKVPTATAPTPGPLTVYASEVDIASNHQGMMVWSQQTHGLTASSGFSEQSGLFAKSFSGQKSGVRFHENEYAHDGRFVLLSKLDIKEGNYKLAMQANGDAVIAWIEEVPFIASTAVHRFQLRIANFTVASNQWVLLSTAVFINDFIFEDAKFDLDIDDQGNAFAFLDNPTSGLIRMKYDSTTQTWNAAEIVDVVANYGDISIDTSANGNSIAMWIKEGEVFVSEYIVATQTWTAANKIGEGDEIDVAVDDNGDCLAIWRSNGEIFDYQCGKLNLNISATSGGGVTSQPAGINCGAFNGNTFSNCSSAFDKDSSVTLKISEESGFRFASWSGDCVGTNANDITLTMDTTKNCTANFVRLPPPVGNATLTVVIEGGPGAGQVNSDESFPTMQCLNSNEVSTTCTAVYAVGSPVTLVPGYFNPNNLVDWTNCDSVGEFNSCDLILTQDRTVTASFSVQATGTVYSISVSGSNNGNDGDITSSVPAGIAGSIDCPNVKCSDLFIVDVPGNIVITATPRTGKTFIGWGTGQCNSETRIGGIGTCTMSLTPGSLTTRRADAFFI